MYCNRQELLALPDHMSSLQIHREFVLFMCICDFLCYIGWLLLVCFCAFLVTCVHDTYNKQNHPTVTLWSSTSYHHSVNPEFNHLPYCTSVQVCWSVYILMKLKSGFLLEFISAICHFELPLLWAKKKVTFAFWHKKILLKNRCIWMKPNMSTLFSIHLPNKCCNFGANQIACWRP
jgi:hypothetical protein